MQSDDLSQYGVRVRVGVEEPQTLELSYQVLDRAPIGMALLDSRGDLYWVNIALAHLTGCSTEALLALPRQDLLATDDDADPFAPVFEGARDRVTLELPWRRVDGEHRWVSLHASLATDPGGFPLELGPERRSALILQIIDISERKKAEAALEALRVELTDRNEELQRSNEELEEFAYVASHDISEPLRVISGHVQLLADRYADSLDDDAHAWIGFAVDGCTRMRSLIDDLLPYSRVGRAERAHAPVDLAEVLERARWGLAVAVEDADGRIEAGALPTVHGDVQQLVQVVANLLGNALKFRSPDRAPVIRISSSRTGDGWRICVADNGIGIPERHRERVFKLFQRLHGRDTYSGTGLGLAISRKIIGRHGGRIWVDDGIDSGTSVCFTIPDAVTDDPMAPEEAIRT